ncbi:hypothetical protein [Mycobacterium simiae]|uniref:hypothetical protein n=1 Tax=Mycobacterium simiae TaxID=1784 RepID=UPI002620FD08|nr:hypothetical protein [Mycobacterium simiae]
MKTATWPRSLRPAAAAAAAGVLARLAAQRTRPSRRAAPGPDPAATPAGEVIRWPNGDIWIPTPMPPSGLFGTPTRRDWQHHARAATAQARALARVVTLYDSHRADAQRLSQPPGPHQ